MVCIELDRRAVGCPFCTPKRRSAHSRCSSSSSAIYFFVSFPMFFRLDETSAARCSAWRTVVDSLAASMLVTLLLDFWRLGVGALDGDVISGLPWMS